MSVKVLPNSNKFYATLEKVRKYCITKSPGFAGVALLPEYKIIDPKDPLGNEYGFTDGRGIWLGTRLFKESPKAQAFVIIHEVLHVALRHPQRGLALKKSRLSRGLPWSSQVFNWAADAIIHFSMQGLSTWVNKPDVGCITFSDLLKPEVLENRPAHTWNVEQLFSYMMDNVIGPAINNSKAENSSDTSDNKVQDVKSWGENNLPKNGRGMLDVELPDTDSKGKGEIKEDTRAESRNWENRVKRAAAGDRPGGVMKEILFDIPITKTPWRQILRKYVSEAVMPKTQIKPIRPSRQAIILDAFYKENCSECIVPFMPAYQPMPGIRKIVVVVDTSGSIDDEICEYFAGEIQSVRTRLGCDLVLITCDTEVHQTIKINAYDNLHSIIKEQGGFKGRGGTDFVPGVKAAEKIRDAAVIIYLTDMEGPYPQKCKTPLIWASISENYQKPPVGRVIVLDKNI